MTNLDLTTWATVLARAAIAYGQAERAFAAAERSGLLTPELARATCDSQERLLSLARGFEGITRGES